MFIKNTPTWHDNVKTTFRKNNKNTFKSLSVSLQSCFFFFFLFENDTTEKQKKFSFSDFSFLLYKFIRKNATIMHYEAKLFREMLTDI